MKRIGLLSDTHGFFDPKFLDLFAEVDELWHAGDVGSEAVLDVMEDFKPVRAVYGNIDDAQRSEEHTSELQSRPHLVCRLLLEKKKKKKKRKNNKIRPT